MLRWLARNLWNILLSVILAVIVWVVAVNEANPSSERTFELIPIAFVNQPPDTVVYDVSASTVDVTVSAPRETWADLNDKVITATVDLSQPRESYPVQASVLDSNVRPVGIVHVEPPSVSAKVEPRDSAQFSVEVNLVGEPARTYKIDSVATQPPTATVTGPASSVSQVAKVASEFSVQGLSQPVSQTIALKVLGADGQVVPNVQVIPDRVRLSVDFEQQAGFRNLSVKVEMTGTQASGYRLAGVDVIPPTVTLIGSSNALESLPAFVATELIDISGAQTDIEKDVPLVLPPDVALFDRQSVRVVVKIEPIVGSLTIPSQPIAIGLQPGLAVRVSPETVGVILEGALPVLETIDLGQDVRVILDLSDLGIGTHQIEPRVETPEGVVARSVLPATVQVIIERAPRGTPTPTVTPLPTRRP
ncbi:MAG TPA: CdaR family protein [Anaerolineae bacterium]|nr:CdaR family protein [Anaerolineae bacterium]